MSKLMVLALVCLTSFTWGCGSPSPTGPEAMAVDIPVGYALAPQQAELRGYAPHCYYSVDHKNAEQMCSNFGAIWLPELERCQFKQPSRGIAHPLFTLDETLSRPRCLRF